MASHSATIRVECDGPGVTISPRLYGLFFEDINFGADGGLSAELIQNRSFEYHSLERTHPGTGYHPLFAWEKVERAGAQARIEVRAESPLHPDNPHYLEVTITHPGVAGVSNSGYGGIPLDAGAQYDVSLYARRISDGMGDALGVRLELPDGTVVGGTDFHGLESGWRSFRGTIRAEQTTDEARLVLTATGRGGFALDVVSLFPRDTFRGRPSGLRKDLVQALADLHPKFLRFPGGCIAHGAGLANRYQWKDTVGEVSRRRPNWNLWGYHQSYALGYFEYFQLCEDLDVLALPVLPVGISCGARNPEVVPMDQLQPHIQDVLDLIEFAKGPATTPWGGVRASMGHPAPFRLEFLCLGNEEDDTPEMRERFPHFVTAIRNADPDVKIIGTSGLGPTIPLYDLMTAQKVFSSDEHYYQAPEWFVENENRFDSFDRSGPRIFVGEYASKDNTLFNGLAEAAFLTGIERNADFVDMCCYAPLLGRAGHTQWDPNLIYFDKRRVLRTANYHVQWLFSRNTGDIALARTITWEGEGRPPFQVATSRDSRAGEVIVKLVNPTTTPVDARIVLEGVRSVAPRAGCHTLTGEPTARNTFEHPDAVQPVTSEIPVTADFRHALPPMALQILRISAG